MLFSFPTHNAGKKRFFERMISVRRRNGDRLDMLDLGFKFKFKRGKFNWPKTSSAINASGTVEMLIDFIKQRQ